jgi:short-subunit dehydrogenase
LRAAVSGRLVVITGASRGIGATVAGRLALAGARVILLARSSDDLADVAARIRARGGAAEWLAVDLRDTDAAAAAGRSILADQGTPDIVISNAGHSIHRSLADSTDRFHDVTRSAGVNFLGPVALLLPLLPAMTARGSGQLVSVSSTSVSLPAPGWSVYGASKSAFEAWLRAVAPELRAGGVAATSIRLPLVHTAMSAPTYAGMPGLSARGAAQLVCRAIVDRPRLISPWWVRLGGFAMEAAPGLSDWVLARWDPTR